MQRLIPNYREVEADYFRRTKIFPIMHTVALREEYYEKQPWVAQSLFKAFAESKRLCQEAMYEFSALKYMMAWSIDEMEKEREVLGEDPWAYGLEPNRHILETLVQYAHEQGLIKKKLEHRPRCLLRALWKNSRFRARNFSSPKIALNWKPRTVRPTEPVFPLITEPSISFGFTFRRSFYEYLSG